MRKPPPSVSSPGSDSFLLIKISRRGALYLSVGLLAFAAAIAFRPAENAPRADDLATAAASTPGDPARAPAPEENPREPSAASVADVPPPVPAAISKPEPALAQAPPPPALPVPATAATRPVVASDPSEAATRPTAPDALNADGSPPAQPSDSNSPSTSAPNADPPAPPTVSPVVITGAGSSSAHRLYSRWFEAFHALRGDVQFDYRWVGSGAGLKQLLEGMVAFSGVDAPLSDEQLGFAKLPLLHIPSTISAVVFVYNLPGVPELRLTPRILAGIFTGKITAWNDPLIAASNSNANLPAVPIVVIHRTDGCSTTRVFTNYLSKVSSEWQQRVGEGSSVHWPLGLGANGNEGVLGLVKQYGGGIAYVDFPYASENHLAFARVQNRSGQFVKADAPSLTAAAASSAIPEDFRVSITNAPGSDAYPVASLMWFVIPAPDPADTAVRDVAAFLRWTTEKNPQAAAANFGFAPLPEKLLERVDHALQAIH